MLRLTKLNVFPEPAPGALQNPSMDSKPLYSKSNQLGESLSEDEEPLIVPSGLHEQEGEDEREISCAPSLPIGTPLDKPIKRSLQHARKMIPPNLEEYVIEELHARVPFEVRFRWKSQPWYEVKASLSPLFSFQIPLGAF